ncbi:MAG: hypothetical protein C4549_06700 [Deltaproteobacteria bacterium]|nr:MAG: hypothetical protein C4549_06700 [Deltaproteobacteria bacterium]
MANNFEDTHFYLDNASPVEVTNVLRVLSPSHEFTPKEISDTLRDSYGFSMQKDYTLSPRRLFDLGLTGQNKKGSVVKYTLTELGSKVQNILGIDPALAMDLLHYLHYSGYTGKPTQRKYLWSYRRCCEIVWGNMRALRSTELASTIQSEMREKFDWLDYGKRTGARFNDKAAVQVYSWLRSLEPSPFEKSSSTVTPRKIDRYEIALLALDEAYQTSDYTYGDPVIMDNEFIKLVSGVFMLDPECCKGLLGIGARINQSVKISETLSGASINLMRPFKIDSI